MVIAIAALVAVVVIVIAESAVWSLVWRLALLVLAVALARYALARDVRTLKAGATPGTPVPAAEHGVLIMNLKSGGGKAERFHLADECRKRGIEPVVLQPGDDMLDLARDAIDRGADVIGMAGGDGSQALVASIAAERDVPMVVIPAGTRNHLALDLGIDRDDVVGALDAFGAAVERPMDLGEVNGHVFVNNVSLGPLRRNRPIARIPRREGRHDPVRAPQDARPRLPARWTCASTDPTARTTTAPTSCWCPTVPTARRSPPCPADLGSTPARSGSRRW